MEREREIKSKYHPSNEDEMSQCVLKLNTGSRRCKISVETLSIHFVSMKMPQRTRLVVKGKQNYQQNETYTQTCGERERDGK